MIRGEDLKRALQRLVSATGDEAAIIAFALEMPTVSVQMRWVSSGRACCLREMEAADNIDGVVESMLFRIESDPCVRNGSTDLLSQVGGGSRSRLN
jgi:hypothetical protein